MAKLPELLLLIKIAGLWLGSERRAERDAMSFAARAPSRGSLGLSVCNLNLKARWKVGRSRAPDSRGGASLLCTRMPCPGPRAR